MVFMEGAKTKVQRLQLHSQEYGALKRWCQELKSGLQSMSCPEHLVADGVRVWGPLQCESDDRSVRV